MATIQIKIDKLGNASLDVSGTTGVNCEQLTKAFEEALGTKVESQLKPEYYVELEDMQIKVNESDDGEC